MTLTIDNKMTLFKEAFKMGSGKKIRRKYNKPYFN